MLGCAPFLPGGGAAAVLPAGPSLMEIKGITQVTAVADTGRRAVASTRPRPGPRPAQQLSSRCGAVASSGLA